MKILFVVRNPSFFYQYRFVVDCLCQTGHKVEFVVFDPEWKSAGLDCALLDEYKQKASGMFDYSVADNKVGVATRLLRAKREIVNFLAYNRPEPISTSRYMIERARSWLPRWYRFVSALPLIGIPFKSRVFANFLEFMENWLPAESRYVSALNRVRPDLVVASPYIFTRSREIDYVRAAKRAGIPTAVIIYSWDNLTTKGLLQVHPDTVLVWNDQQRDELAKIHDFPKNRAVATGAPAFDYWFEHQTQIDKPQFLRDLGIDGDPRIVTYLCSSRTIAPREKQFIDEFAEVFQQLLGPKGFVLLVRPHPQNEKIWAGANSDNYAIAPRITSDLYRSAAARDYFYATLKHSSCVVGMNTTAILEALILGRPSISILSGQNRETQEDTPHFQYLANSDVVAVCPDFKTACDAIIRLASFGDTQQNTERRARMENFVKSFVHPGGWEQMASRKVAEVLLKSCRAEKSKTLNQYIDSNSGDTKCAN